MKRWLFEQYIKWELPTMLDKLKTFALGYGTYATGVAMIVHGVSGYITGACTEDDCVKEILNGLGLLFLRRAIK